MFKIQFYILQQNLNLHTKMTPYITVNNKHITNLKMIFKIFLIGINYLSMINLVHTTIILLV